jgi:hypothetical protein
MSKYKIEIELDIDFQKFFDNIPKGLFRDNEDCDERYELGAIYDVLNKTYLNALTNKMNWMVKPEYKHMEHHVLIKEEISKQISSNYKVIKINFMSLKDKDVNLKKGG